MLPLTRSRNRSRFFGLAIPQSALDLDFLSGTLDPRITFTRASSGAFFGSDGLLQTASTDVPRFDYDPVTLAARGLLIEEQRTNLLLWSEDFGNAAWTKQTSVTVTADSTTAPDGTTSADTINDGDATASGSAYEDVTVTTSSNPYTYSVYLKKGSTNVVALSVAIFGGTSVGGAVAIDLNNGNYTAAASIAVAPTSVAVTNIGDGWYRVAMTLSNNNSVGNTTIRCRVHPAYASALNTPVNVLTTTTSQDVALTGNCIVWGAQLEVGSFATSYIKTEASQVTRATDIAVMTGTNFSSWFNASQGTLFTSGLSLVTNAATRALATIDDTTLTNRIELDLISGSLGGVGRATVTSSGSTQFDTGNASAPTFVAGTVYSAAVAYSTDNFAYSLNGGVATTDSLGTVPTGLSVFVIGARSSLPTFLNGHIRRIVYWPVRIPNSQLQFITA